MIRRRIDRQQKLNENIRRGVLNTARGTGPGHDGTDHRKQRGRQHHSRQLGPRGLGRVPSRHGLASGHHRLRGSADPLERHDRPQAGAGDPLPGDRRCDAGGGLRPQARAAHRRARRRPQHRRLRRGRGGADDRPLTDEIRAGGPGPENGPGRAGRHPQAISTGRPRPSVWRRRWASTPPPASPASPSAAASAGSRESTACPSTTCCRPRW